MDSYEGTATLEWWANQSTCLSRLGVRIAVCVVGSHWTCTANLEPPLSAGERQNFALLMQLDPHFTLRFDEENTLLVCVVEAEVERLLSLTAA
ncbi:hypothetical protein ACIOEW_20705 [Streptomyces sp. NPDC087901]|uniref:hypothetical protein n=1 Tax=Streptomyces sp. NPDC087901 TaxID=3365818 RepID=UPI0038211D8D